MPCQAPGQHPCPSPSSEGQVPGPEASETVDRSSGPAILRDAGPGPGSSSGQRARPTLGLRFPFWKISVTISTLTSWGRGEEQAVKATSAAVGQGLTRLRLHPPSGVKLLSGLLSPTRSKTLWSRYSGWGALQHVERQARPAPPGCQEHPRRDRTFPEQEPRGGGGQHCPVSRCAVALEVLRATCVERGLPAAPEVGSVTPGTGASPT